MKLKEFIFILIVGFFATFLRFYISNNFVISIIGSFLFGYVIARRLSKSTNEILLVGFCSCFTSFTGFVNFLNRIINMEEFIQMFLYLNLICILNLFVMYFGFTISRKIT